MSGPGAGMGPRFHVSWQEMSYWKRKVVPAIVLPLLK